jgi:farnesyl diphosphate synthase
MLTKDYIKTNDSFQSFIYFVTDCQNRVNNFLQQTIDGFFSKSDELFSATKYSLLGGGKRLRPALVYAIGNYFELNDLTILNAAAASLELIHCYSLIHDDLPAMDNDDLRRGQPSCHKAFSEAKAILVGDGLQTLAFQILADSVINKFDSETRCNMVLKLAKAAGFSGMVNGQAQDIAYESIAIRDPKEFSLSNLERLHANKTGALIVCCIELAILAAFANDNKLSYPTVKQQLLNYGYHLGLIFQIQDDILDFEQSTEILGKTHGSDQKLHKATFVTILGLDGAKQQLEQHYNEAILALQNLAMYNNSTNLLRQFADGFKIRNF